MEWFKIVLLVILGASVLVNLNDVSKGNYMKEQSPVSSAIAAVLGVLLISGILYFL